MSTSNYKIISTLGRGGMGVVYKAQDKRLGRHVAIKVIAEQFAEHTEVLKRFDREARAAARLNHPNIVTVYGIDEVDDLPAIVMEYVQGQSLDTIIKSDRAVDTSQALTWVGQVANALAYAHRAKVIHRDIKPHNIIVQEETGDVKVADFGLARMLEEQTDLTATGTQPGSPLYMSPEQVQGKSVGIATDIYSLGVVLYALLAGRPPFSGESTAAVLRQVLEGPFPNVRDVNSNVPEGVVQILTKMVERDPTHRYASAAFVKEAIDEFLATGEVGEYTAVTPATPATPVPSIQVFETPTDKDFVVHYVDSDSAWAEWLHLQLKEAGYQGELLPWDFKAAHESLRTLVKDVRRGTALFVVASPPYLAAIHGNPEWTQAFMHGELDPIPVRVRTCKFTGTFRTVNYIDLMELDRETGKAAILSEIRELRGDRQPLNPIMDFKSVLDTSTGGGTQSVSNLPFASNEDFVGRSRELSTLYDIFENQGKDVAVLIGKGKEVSGYGTSRLAAEYGRLNRHRYDVIWWVNAQEGSLGLLTYCELANQLHLAESSTESLPVTRSTLKQWLATNERWLLIFDGVGHRGKLSPYIPPNRSGHVLITSTNHDWPTKYNPVSVGPFERSEATDYLFRRTRERNEGAAASLAAALSDLPLPLELASAYIVSEKLTMDSYIGRLLDRHRGLWRSPDPPKDMFCVSASVLSLSLERIAKESPGAADLLKLCAYLAPTPVRLSRIVSGAKLFPKSLAKALQNPTKLQEAVKLLTSYRLISEENDGISAHPLIRDIVQKWLEIEMVDTLDKPWLNLLQSLRSSRPERRRTDFWASTSANFILAVLPERPENRDSWREFERLLPHALTQVKTSSRLSVCNKEASEIARRVGRFLIERSVYDRAAKAYRWAVENLQESPSARAEEVAELYRELGRVYWNQNVLQRAREAYLESLRLEQSRRNSDQKIAECLCSLGNISMELTDFTSARDFYHKALNLDLKIHGDVHKDVARDHSNLGLVSQELGDLTAAWKYYRQALEVLEQIHDNDHPAVASAVKNFAGLLYTMGDYAEAKRFYNRAIDIDKALHGEHHPTVAQDFHNLAMTQEALGFVRDAVDHYRKALAINEAVFGRRHAKAALNMNNLGNILLREGDLEAAEAYYTEAREIFEKEYGKTHRLTQIASKNLRRIRERRNQDKSGPKVP